MYRLQGKSSARKALAESDWASKQKSKRQTGNQKSLDLLQVSLLSTNKQGAGKKRKKKKDGTGEGERDL